MVENELSKNFPALFSDQDNLDAVLRDLYDKCAYPYDISQDADFNYTNNSFVISKDVIDYLATNVFENDANNSVILQLKRQFYEHFDLNSELDDSLLSERSLDFTTFKEILIKWIDQMTKNEKSQPIDIQRFKTSNSYLCSKKLQNLKYSVSCYENFNSIHTKLNDELKFSSLNENAKIKLSNRSLSLSNNDLNQSHDTDLQAKYLKIELNKSKHEIIDLKSENFKLRDNIEILRTQLQLAEETNSQLGTDMENQTKKLNDLSKKNHELYMKLSFCDKDIDELRSQNEDLKSKMETLKIENASLNQKMEENLFLISIKENQLANANATLDENQNEIELLLKQLEEQKGLYVGLQNMNSILEKNNCQLDIKLNETDEKNKKLLSSHAELLVEIQSLKEKCLNLESESKAFSQKMLKKNQSNENKKSIKTPLKDRTNFMSNRDASNDETQTDFHAVSKYNTPVLNFSSNGNPFLIEQFETNFVVLKDKNGKTEYEVLVDSLESFLNFFECLRKQLDDIPDMKQENFKLRDSNNNKSLETKKSNNLINADKLFNYLMNGQINEISLNEKLQNLVDQSRTLFSSYRLLLNNYQSLASYVNGQVGKASVRENHNFLKSTPIFDANSKSDYSFRETNINNLTTTLNIQLDPDIFCLVSTPYDKTNRTSDDTISSIQKVNIAHNLNSTNVQTLKSDKNLKKRRILNKSLSFSECSNQSLIESVKKINDLTYTSHNLSNHQIIPDLVDSGFSKNLFESTELQLNTPSSISHELDKKKFKFKNFLTIHKHFLSFFRSNYQKLKAYVHKDSVFFFRMTFSIFIFGFSVIFFLITLGRDDTFLRQLILMLSNSLEIKNPFDSIRAN